MVLMYFCILGQFENVSSILRNYAEIWTPILGFAGQPIDPPLTNDYPVEVRNDGSVHFGFKTEITVLTDLSTESYPFDSQTIWIILQQLKGGVELVNLQLHQSKAR